MSWAATGSTTPGKTWCIHVFQSTFLGAINDPKNVHLPAFLLHTCKSVLLLYTVAAGRGRMDLPAWNHFKKKFGFIESLQSQGGQTKGCHPKWGTWSKFLKAVDLGSTRSKEGTWSLYIYIYARSDAVNKHNTCSHTYPVNKHKPCCFQELPSLHISLQCFTYEIHYIPVSK